MLVHLFGRGVVVQPDGDEVVGQFILVLLGTHFVDQLLLPGLVLVVIDFFHLRHLALVLFNEVPYVVVILGLGRF